MTMTMEHSGNRNLGGLNFDGMSYGHGSHFTNPFNSGSSQLYNNGMSTNHTGYDSMTKAPSRVTSTHMPYAPQPAPTTTLSSQYQTPSYQHDLLGASQDLINGRGTFDQSASAVGGYAPTSAPYVNNFAGVSASQHEDARRLSHASSMSSHSRGLNEAIDASRGMVALSQDLTTPRGNMYGNTTDRAAEYFPNPHSAHSSVSSASYPSSYYASSVEGSVSDYGSQSDLESVSSRTLPRPTALIGTNALPPPQSMMGQFNSKISSSTQKKHKCKVCDKRFTRPSSLQTHMYSHTGEKPYACEVEGCGRHFSVVSNLRRHRKVHKGDRGSVSDSEHASPEGSWSSEK